MGSPRTDSDPERGLTAPDLYAFFEKSQWWDGERLVAYQRQMLDGLVRHARATAPFYAYRLSSLFRTDGSIDWSKWHNLPTLSRKDLSSYIATIQSRTFPAAHGPFLTAQTTGTTGHPVSLTATGWQAAMTRAMGWRAQAWSDADWSRTLLTRIYHPIPDMKNGDDLGPWGPPAASKSKLGKNIYSYNLDHEQFLDFMLVLKPAYISILSASIDVLCEMAERRKSALKVETFFSRGGGVSKELRERTKSLFGARIFEGYSSQECGSIAYECPSGSGLHISAEAALVEIVRDDGNSAQPGEEGRVVVTPFASSATPLIRYDQGDRAVAGETCACGRSLPLIRSILGRQMQAFRHPDGRVFFGARIASLRQTIGASRWQIAQIGPVRFEVRYIAEKEAEPNIVDRFVREFRANIFDDAEIRFTRVADISVSGKFIEYVNEWTGSNRLRSDEP